MASDLGWFAALSLGCPWRRWRKQWGTTAASAATGMSVLQSYRHMHVCFKIPCVSLGCSLRGPSPVLGLAWYGMLAGHWISIKSQDMVAGVRAHAWWRAMALEQCLHCGRPLWYEGPALPLGSSWKVHDVLWGGSGDVGEEVRV